MKHLFLSFILCASFQALPAIAAEDPMAIKKCFGALNAFEASVAKEGARVKPDWLKGQRGQLVFMAQSSDAVKDEVRNYSGSTREISICASAGLSPTEISLFLMAYHGYLPPDLFEDFSGCFAAFLISASEMDKKLGMQRSESLSFHIGKQFGERASQLNYLYGARMLVLEDVHARAMRIQEQVARLSATSRSKAAKALSEKCKWYGIPLDDVLEAAHVMAH
jgi:hypothetical protein